MVAAIGAIAASLLLGGCASPGGSSDDGAAAQIRTTARTDGYHGVLLEKPYAMPDVTFTTSDGGTLDPSTHQVAPVTLVFFGYSHCPDVCNAVLADVAAALRRADDGVRERTALLFVTTDPARDTPEVMRDYLARFDPSFLGLRTDLETTKTVATSLGVALTGNTKLPGGGYDVGHSAQVIGFDAEGAGRLVWTPGTPVGDLRADLTRLARG
jgi:Uncharacterized protein SCO1/SenC/PrrC, involved in biogenesis of respiratory and photosynthetic systems